MIRRIILSLLLLALVASTLMTQPLTRTNSRPGISFDLGIASYAYREKDLEEVIRSAQKLNVKKLALKSFHLPLESSDAKIEAVKSRIEAAGLDLYAGSVIYMKSEKEVAEAFDYAEKAGMNMIVGVPNPELMDVVEQKVKAYDIQKMLEFEHMLFPLLFFSSS